jgi:hypothetical protein
MYIKLINANRFQSAFRWTRFSIITILILMILTIVTYHQATAEPTLAVNTKFGTVSRVISKLYVNTKPFVAIRHINLSQIIEDNINLLKQTEQFIKIASKIEPKMPDYYNKGQDKWTEDNFETMHNAIRLINESGSDYNNSKLK